jgi:hypothetical protein
VLVHMGPRVARADSEDGTSGLYRAYVFSSLPDRLYAFNPENTPQGNVTVLQYWGTPML